MTTRRAFLAGLLGAATSAAAIPATQQRLQSSVRTHAALAKVYDTTPSYAEMHPVAFVTSLQQAMRQVDERLRQLELQQAESAKRMLEAVNKAVRVNIRVHDSR